MPPELLAILAERFKAFAEPARLQVLYSLRGGEKSVNDLVALTGLGQANLSKHLQVLHAAGLVVRRREGAFAYHALADGDVLQLCDLVCGRLDKESRALLKALSR
ncbi:MAG: helix-turn-helix transcriptional regulator [Gemmatimonadetes bacterium]|nr:helix-turn-helix transcriptional regulator [Gemmatimonadota bacterium]